MLSQYIFLLDNHRTPSLFSSWTEGTADCSSGHQRTCRTLLHIKFRWFLDFRGGQNMAYGAKPACSGILSGLWWVPWTHLAQEQWGSLVCDMCSQFCCPQVLRCYLAQSATCPIPACSSQASRDLQSRRLGGRGSTMAGLGFLAAPKVVVPSGCHCECLHHCQQTQLEHLGPSAHTCCLCSHHRWHQMEWVGRVPIWEVDCRSALGPGPMLLPPCDPGPSLICLPHS